MESFAIYLIKVNIQGLREDFAYLNDTILATNFQMRPCIFNSFDLQ